jgi:hypothetical protein
VGLGMAGGAFAGTGTEAGATTYTQNPTDIAVGQNASAASKTKDAIAIGDAAKSTADGAIAIGGSVQNQAANSIIMGNAGGTLNAASLDSASTGSVFFAPAGGTVNTSKNSFSFNPNGTTATTGSDDSVNISGSVTNSPGAVAIGKAATISKAGGVAIGTSSSVTAVNAVAIGANSVAAQRNQRTVVGDRRRVVSDQCIGPGRRLGFGCGCDGQRCELIRIR